MTRAAALAEVYSLPIADVERWPAPVADVLYRNAVRRGWLMNDPTTDRNPT